ncbi:hypothetical protein Q4543_07210 [Salipiger sp. 1_MG-2023]|uniref:hypothetical protein n=1 Tax=Salipiger sp. 1_MG-2023 TaxID=3062665 RepID=UPI0026E2B2FE|nr:hypothetical protein [Salipiger sp. 1_MG-2023]MDO6585303.1 hypothetical protein [Salipiger sp. 1_MG-2023]
MYTHKFRMLALLITGWATPALAADFSDPTWPCIQRKVETLSMGLMWPAALPETTPDADKAAIHELAATLALRRVDLDAARAASQGVASEHGHDMDLMGAVFAQTFNALAQRRTRIIKGIGEVAQSQERLSQRIETARAEMDSIMASDTPDYDRVDALEEQVDWDSRIFNDRQKTITYLCETPTLLEKRLYALSQILQEAARPDGG